MRHKRKGKQAEDIGKALAYVRMYRASDELQRVQLNIWSNAANLGIIRGKHYGVYAVAEDFGFTTFDSAFFALSDLLLMPSYYASHKNVIRGLEVSLENCLKCLSL